MSIAPAVVEAPTRLPAQYGLFSVLTFPAESQGRWEAGVTWEADACSTPAGTIGPPTCEDGEATYPGVPKTFKGSGGVATADAFTVYGSYDCSGPGAYSIASEKALADLLLNEERAVEAAFWSGALGNLPTLIDSPTTLSTDQTPGDALGAVEEFISSNYGGQGVVHVGRRTATKLAAADLVLVVGGSLRTVLGTPVVAGSGYPGTSPAGADGDWIYGTGALFGYRSEVFQSDQPMFNTANNDATALAERTYLIGFDPCGVGAAEFGGTP